MSDKKVCVGVFGSAHGVRGQIRIKSETQDVLDIARYKPLMSEDGSRLFELKNVRPLPKNPMMVVANVDGVATRNDAESLTNVKIYTLRSSLPDLTDEEDYYHADLIGMKALGLDGKTQGIVVGIYNFGSGDVLEISTPKKQRIMLPFTKANVPTLDFQNHTLTLAQDLPKEP